MRQLYFDYLLERENVHTLGNEHSFITYKIEKDHVYMQDIYTEPEARDTKSMLSLYTDFVELMKRHGKHRIFVSIVPSTAGATKSLNIALKFGYNLHSASNDVIFLRKEI